VVKAVSFHAPYRNPEVVGSSAKAALIAEDQPLHISSKIRIEDCIDEGQPHHFVFWRQILNVKRRTIEDLQLVSNITNHLTAHRRIELLADHPCHLLVSSRVSEEVRLNERFQFRSNLRTAPHLMMQRQTISDRLDAPLPRTRVPPKALESPI
jgi:hypothetical protein